MSNDEIDGDESLDASLQQSGNEKAPDKDEEHLTLMSVKNDDIETDEVDETSSNDVSDAMHNDSDTSQVTEKPIIIDDQHAADVDRELKRLSRRGFIAAAVAAAAAAGTWSWLRSRPLVDGVPAPFRRMLGVNEWLAERYFRSSRLSPNFPPGRVTRSRVNGHLGLDPAFDSTTWRLRIEGLAGAAAPAVLTLDDIKRFPRVEMITELRCIEGWSIIVRWAGARLFDVMKAYPPPNVDYVAMETPDRGYYVGLDMASARHPQTLLAYEMNGAPLTGEHGAPLRLAIPVKYGIKNIKRIGVIRYTASRPDDYWAKQGYDWYAGH